MAQKILITEEIVPAGIEILKEKGYEVDCKFDLSREELLDIIEDYDALIVRSATKVDREIFEIGKKLRVVGRAGVGIDNIDIEAANAYGVIVDATRRYRIPSRLLNIPWRSCSQLRATWQQQMPA